ncbi:MAG: penicillin acylase family protein [Anaerolineae bacterium]
MKLPHPLSPDRVNLFRRKKWLLAPAVLGAATGLNYAARRFLRRPLPQTSGEQTIQGLSKPVEIIRDRWGVPHIYAQTEQDLFFAQGFVHAQDRLFQMDINRRVGVGRLSEIIGPAGLASDRLARIFGWTRAAAAQVARGDSESRVAAEAFAEGVNAFISQGRLPVEFSILAYKPEPWHMADSAAWGAVLAWGLSVNWETELMRAMLIEKLGPEKTADLTPGYDDNYQTILPESRVGARLAQAMLEAYRQAASQLPAGIAPLGRGQGSNNWVVHGSLTASGRPILANDPHLPPIFPSIWYENHLGGGRYNVTGFTMPGIPGVIIGHNEHIAWGVTNAFPDVQDIYVEHMHPEDPTLYEANGRWYKAEVVTETIKVRGRKPVIEQVRYTRHGPIISDLIPGETQTLSLRWASYGRNDHMQSILEINRAADWERFRDGLRCWGFPSQNVVYADVAGNIGYMMPGMVPKRRKGAGLVPVPGWNDDHEWEGWIPFEELPVCTNPSEGMIITANNKIAGDSYPHLLTGEWLPDYRARRIRKLLTEARPLTLADNQHIQSDTVSLLARRFLTSALSLLELGEQPDGLAARARQWLREWDHDMRADQVAPSIYFGWLINFARAVIKQAVGEDLAEAFFAPGVVEGLTGNPFQEIAPELAVRWLEGGSPAWVGDIRPLLLPAFLRTLQTLRQQFGRRPETWQWGRLHRLDLHNHFARLPGLGRIWKPVTLPIGGSGFTVNQSEVSPHFPPGPVQVIASCRLILDVGEWDNSVAALPGGQSGHLASAHYQDGIEAWQHGRYHPLLFSRERVEAAVEDMLTLRPA